MQQFGGKDAKRHFTVVMSGKEHGLYVSSTPSSAAKKAVTKLCAANKSKKVQFEIREITQGSKKKTYGPYSGHIEKLKEPIELKGRVIKYKPVAKLSGKSGAKKGGMRGGTRIYECYTKIPRTDYTFKIERLNTDRNKFPAEKDYLLTLINNSNPETIKLSYGAFLAHLMMSDDAFITYLNNQSNEQKKNLSVNFKEKMLLGSDGNWFITTFLSKCYNFEKYGNVEIKDNAQILRMAFINPLERYKEIMLPNPGNVNIREWERRINEWLG
jgi:hypothetical protein